MEKTKEESESLEFEVHNWNGGLENFGKKISYTVDVKIDGKRKAIIYIPIDGSEPKTMRYEQESFPPGIHTELVDDIMEEHGLLEKFKEVYPNSKYAANI